MNADLEALREIFKDTRQHIAIGTIVKLGLAKDGSKLRVMVNLLPENRELVAEMTFADVMDVEFPELKDLALVGFVDGHPDECYILKLVSTKEEPIPKFAQTGDKVSYSRPGKKLYLGSDTKLGIGRPNHEPTEPLVLGTQLVAFMTGVLEALDAVLAAIGSGPAGDFGNLGAPVPISAAIASATADAVSALNALKSTFLTTSSTNVISQIAFTERGV